MKKPDRDREDLEGQRKLEAERLRRGLPTKQGPPKQPGLFDQIERLKDQAPSKPKGTEDGKDRGRGRQASARPAGGGHVSGKDNETPSPVLRGGGPPASRKSEKPAAVDRVSSFHSEAATAHLTDENLQSMAQWLQRGGPPLEVWKELFSVISLVEQFSGEYSANLATCAALGSLGHRPDDLKTMYIWPGGDSDCLQHHGPIRWTAKSLRRELEAISQGFARAGLRARQVHPVAVLVEEWKKRRPDPQPRTPNLRPDRIMPSRLAQIAASDKRAGRLFMPASHWQPGPQRVFPGFGLERDLRVPALPLALYELGGLAGKSLGRGAAPFSLRLLVEAVLAASLDMADIPTALEIPLRKLLANLYPGSGFGEGEEQKRRRPRPVEYWPALEQAERQINSMTMIPFQDPNTGQGGARRVVMVSGLPRGPHCLDEMVRLVVDLPPGCREGPIMPESLGAWGLISAPAYRALIGLHFLWFDPGRTRFPVGKGKRRHWVQSSRPGDYRRLSDWDQVDLCFPISTQKQRRNLVSRAHKTFGRLLDAGEVRHVDGVWMPPE